MSEHEIAFTVNGREVAYRVEARRMLGEFLRGEMALTGLHLGCEHGVCGACTILVDGLPMRACLMLAVQANGCNITTVEGLAGKDGTLHHVQQAMKDEYGLQCGFCTPGVLMTLASFADRDHRPDEEALKEALSGHLCRCTGYQGMLRVARRLAGNDRDTVTEVS
jgi:carbon-monoxide dehydrogenase small subunit